ncbi:hypothetical protein FPSE_11053 [Fusarium pseudograminearum CS3096]|uniref:ATP-citrate synthase/succinyl-CoA ligase C-terminal domain-containing protein n=1 Tax=Fusarium pseudograminearum (strain CS3096) TaxID=1028729 RepID=K3VXF0_FUSPC|nr:hypothetical protein FPSE_11053 [Fusarium pseudograminearum CS3096]EKJ68785.1 hypothetical protein FPSE_11053 [Fusarium pseudograminearum CS3096]
MYILEHHSQNLLRKYGGPIPNSFSSTQMKSVLKGLESFKTLIGPRPSVVTKSPSEARMLAAEVLPEDGLKSYLKGDLQPRKTVYFQEELDLYKHWHLTMTIDRKACRPVIKIRDAKPDNKTRGAPEGELFQKNYLFDLSDTDSEFMAETIQKIASELGLVSATRQGFQHGLIALRKIFMEAQAIFLEVDVLRRRNSKIVFANSRFCFDDDAKKKARNVYLSLWEPLMEDEAELYAETFGLVYVKMDGDIGTVVNGAGLAMATNDAIRVHGGRSANFLDAGGQATNDTMKRAFKIVMDDRRVKTIFVNIYGGITRCDMIAESIIDAVYSLSHQSVPMVVRLQGTNSEEGLKLLEDANLGIHVEADFDKATKKAVELAESIPTPPNADRPKAITREVLHEDTKRHTIEVRKKMKRQLKKKAKRDEKAERARK